MIRRAFYALLSCIVLTVGIALALSIPTSTTERFTNAPTQHAPTVTLPMCDTEDGAGMALCWWDAQRQGNGQGTSVVSGDCAPSIMDEVTSQWCVLLHERPSLVMHNEDGSSNTIPNGADLIAECAQEFDGIELQECIRGWM